jgi:histidinol-phosphate aminotransferase
MTTSLSPSATQVTQVRTETSGRNAPAPRASLAEVPAYVPKPPTPRPAGTSHRLFLNENPFPPLPSVQEVITAGVSRTNLYPPIAPDRLVHRLAEQLSVPVGCLATGPGSIGIYQQIGQAFLPEGTEVVYAWPAFEAFPIVARTASAIPVPVPLSEHRHDLAAMAAAVGPRTSAVFICNPNNPTGTAVSQPELDDFLDRLPTNVLVVVDDAYYEFAQALGGPSADAVATARSRPNVIALRTFSKAYSLAGLRVGYAVAAQPLADALRKCAVPCGVSDLASDAAIASLDAEAELLVRVELIAAERERLADGLAALGWPVVRSLANFVWLPLGAAAQDVADSFQDEGVLIRAFPDEGVRISVGEPAANDRVLAVAGRITADRTALR